MYFCVVCDGHSRRVLGWAMDSVQNFAWSKKRCGWRIRSRDEVADGLVCHSDRGTQFTSEQLWEVCRNLGVAQVMGRSGVCFDNAMAESFWSTLKT
ncbi:DDE-type integrase/transposase/recombinase [Corynebacterium propinquum]|uniref:DDE-type integrase/transposase/recombinase n=1 Tax=Corynebacterium propinquum TaxID=43769 RepID=UPI00119DB009|nr:DDE-type integrase/transposase/recombinase [Corynebacterium propinquum]